MSQPTSSRRKSVGENEGSEASTPAGIVVSLVASALDGTVGVVAVIAVVAVTGVIAALVFNNHRRRRSVRFRVGQAVEGAGHEQTPISATAQPGRSQQQPPGAEARLANLLAPEAEIAGLDISPARLVLLTIGGSALLGLVAALVLGSPWGLLFGLIGPLATRSQVSSRVRRTRRMFEEQLADNLDVVSSGLRAGHSMVGALSVTVEAADEPSRTELGRALADEQLGYPLDAALQIVAERMQSRDLEQVAFVARLQRQAGTNAAEVIDQVSENIRNRMELLRLVRTLTAQGRMARWIVSLLPVGLFIAMYAINRDYLRPLWETTGGKLGMVLAALMVVAGSLIIKQIVEIEV
jgi:tight adherence protein B